MARSSSTTLVETAYRLNGTTAGNDRMNGGPKEDRCSGGKGNADSATNCETVTGVP